MIQSFNIITWNILAPELLFYFWRSSYGLETFQRESDYNIIQKNRIDNISFLDIFN